jgi:thiamine biosynthesis lipoprotein
MAPRLVLDARTLRLIFVAFVLLVGLTVHRLFLAEIPLGSDVLVLDGETMGTTYQVRVAGDGLTDGLQERVAAETERRLSEVDQWMSNWNPESEISRFNAYQGVDEFPVSFETADVITYAIELGKWTDGAFDIAIGPIVAIWGFGNEARIGDPPTQKELDRLLSHTGAHNLRIGRGNPKHGGFLRKPTPETRIDLSAIAKGYGVDHVAAGLLDFGREDFLIEIGGEVRAAGERPGGGPWRVAIEKPDDEGRSIQTVVELQDEAMATSGDYRIFYRHDDKRISHTIDPRTGRPVENGPASATVIHASATVADAWATVLMVMGEKGLELAERQGIAGMLMWRDEDGGISIQRNALFPEDSTPPTE